MKNLLVPTPLFFVFVFVFFFFFLHFHITPRYDPVENIHLNCGTSGNLNGSDSRVWIGDEGSKFGPIEDEPTHKSNAPQKITIPYKTARISNSSFTYTFPVTPGPKFVRLYFYPVSYPGFDRSKAFFTVKAGSFTLLKNFSASLLADHLKTEYFFKEFCIPVQETQELNLSFTPSPSPSGSGDSYAFINGIEIVSMPNDLYYSIPEGEIRRTYIGENYQFNLEYNRALEMVVRLNVGGGLIREDSTGMFREWSQDTNYPLGGALSPHDPNMTPKYTKIKNYGAPDDVYRSAATAGTNRTDNLLSNLTWVIPVDHGFIYLVRLHFCEFQPQITSEGKRQFLVYIDNQTAENRADIIMWSGGNGIPVYRDYIVMIESKRDLFIGLHPIGVGYASAILNGMEVFKLSDIVDGNLAGPNPEPASTTKNSTKKTVFIAVRAGTDFLVLLSLACFMVLWKLRKTKRHGSYRGKSKASSVPREVCRHFSLSEIKTATNNFHEDLIIGVGGFGNVYKGYIDEGTMVVAIKRLNPDSRQGAREFWTEIELLSQLLHIHLVSLIGYCDDEGQMILVYDYMSNGTLQDHLYDTKNDPIPWKKRLEICSGAARGLNYLHTGVKNTIIHRDVKTTNILLDDKWVAKVSDFGLSKMDLKEKAVSSKIKGTFGYLDPEYAMRLQLTNKSDVYSFGVVLFEVLCARKALNKNLEEDQWNLANWAKKCIEKGTVSDIIDPYLRGKIAPECFKVFVNTAESCVRDHGIQRPTMIDVMEKLDFALKLQEDADIAKERINPGSEHKYQEVLSFHLPTTSGGLMELDTGVELTVTSMNSELTILDSSKDTNTIITPARDMVLWKLRKTKHYGSYYPLSKCWCWFWPHDPYRGKSARTKARSSLPEELCRHFSLSEIMTATNNFHEELVIGVGGFGNVYKGYIDEGTMVVAIKRLNPESRQGAREFRTEIELLSQLRHVHLVSLIGYCDDEGQMILVYDYMTNGTLRDHLYDIENDPIPWKKRLEICFGAARGLNYLHTGVNNTIIHRDVKTTNILLDDQWVAKVSDFGLSKMGLNDLAVSTMVKGTIGYLDPDYVKRQQLTDKSDVYSFGVVLFEVLCARKALNPTLQQDQWNLAFWAKKCIEKGTISDIIDPYLIGKIAPECFKVFVDIAEICVHDQGIKRPTMNDVMEKLDFALKLHEDADAAKERTNPGFNSRTKRISNPSLASRLNLSLRISFGDIKKATRNFSSKNFICKGGFGKVYKGTLGGRKVAVKRSRPGHGQGLKEFHTEIMVFSQIRHRHLVSLIGYCDERSEMILVYEYMEKGTLREHLYHSSDTNNSEKSFSRSELSWKQRLEICIDVANGIEYLHTGPSGGIIHRDLKSTNILLDENYVAKVADFGLSRSSNLGPVSMDVKGPFGYLDPEYFQSAQFTEKSDVYAFGVVLLEVLCARPVINNLLPREEVNLANWALHCQRKGGLLEEIIDPMLVGKIPPSSLRKFFETAENCLKINSVERPNMHDVVYDLQYALLLPEVATINPGLPATTGGIPGYNHSNLESDNSGVALTITSMNNELTSLDSSKDFTDTCFSKV